MEIVNLIGYENIEKLAQIKMSQMNYSNIISLISLYKEMKVIDSKNPLYKYLCYYTPYTPKINRKKEDKNELIGNQNYTSFTDTIKLLKRINERTHNCTQKKEKPIKFNSKKNKNLQRYNNIIKRLDFLEQENLAIKIQKHIRSYLKRISIIKTINKIIIGKFMINIIKIQNAFKKIYLKREFKINYFINLICEERKKNITKIQKVLILYYNKVNKKKRMIIQGILDNRVKNIIFLQSIYRAKKIREKVNKLIQYRKNNYILTFPYKAKNVEIKILQVQNKIKFFQTYNLEKCSIENNFKLYINYSDLNPGNYYCQFLIDNKLFIDPRFPYFEAKDGQTFNQIEFIKGKVIEGDKEYNYQKNINIPEIKSYNMEYIQKNNENNKNNYNNKINNSTSIKKNYPIDNNNTKKYYETYNIDYNSYTFNTLKPDLGNQRNSNYENYYNSGHKNNNPFTNYTSDNSNNNSRKQSNEDDYYSSLKKNLEGIVFEYVD